MKEEYERLVVPFYLQMMRTNAGLLVKDGRWEPIDPVSFGKLVAAGRSSTLPEVLALLRDPWRPRVMGAWFSLFHVDPQIGPALLQSLATSAGSLTSPPLATVTALLVGPESVPTMSAYLERDLAHEWGAAGFVAVAMRRLGQPSASCPPSDQDEETFDRLFEFARRLHAMRQPPNGGREDPPALP